MLLASVMGLLKLLLLAYLMPTYEYGQYVTYFGVATFFSVLLSFGLVEKTIKDYPRRWASGQRREIFVDSFEIGRKIIFRCVFFGIFATIISLLGFIPLAPLSVLAVISLALCSSILALIGSLYRACGDKIALQGFTLCRSLLAISFSVLFGALWGWSGAFCGDIIGNLVGIAIAAIQLRHMYLSEYLVPAPTQLIKHEDSGHFKIYIANLMLAPQSMLDRSWVSTSIGSATAGTYSIVMLIPQCIQLLSNVVVQYVGPLVIKSVHLQEATIDSKSSVKFNLVVLAVCSLVLTLFAILVKRLPNLNHIFNKYEISDISLLLVGLVACGQIYSLIEFHLIARNREHDILVASIISSVVFLFVFAVASFCKASVDWFIFGIGLARLSQVYFLGRAYLRYA